MGEVGARAGSVVGPQYAENVARDSQVIAELNHLQAKLDSLGNSITNLNTRLSGVLRGEPPSTSGINKEPVEECLVPLADKIRSTRSSVGIMYREVESILARLEV